MKILFFHEIKFLKSFLEKYKISHEGYIIIFNTAISRTYSILEGVQKLKAGHF